MYLCRKMDFLKNLNKEQLKAVKTVDTPLLISAGAGSGKTRVITYKIAYLIHKLKLPPYSILGLTFTNKAADEMKRRIANFKNNKENLWISTFHSLCTRILRKELNSNFIIIDQGDKNSILKKIIKENNLDKDVYNTKMLGSAISRFKNNRIDYKNNDGDLTDIMKNVFNIYRKYEKLKGTQHYFDFDDLLIETIKLFYKDKNILEKYRKRFQYILVDEFQDTNQSQYELVYLLGYDKKNITIVGDPDQSIYSWRGASIENFNRFKKDFKKYRIIKLEQNYRSANNILQAAASMIKHNSSYDNKVLWSKRKKGSKIKVLSCISIHDESDFIINQIKKFNKEGAKYKDIAVFCRTNYYYQNLEFKLQENNVPYKIIGGLKFFEKYEIKILLAYLKFLHNKDDIISLMKIINCPTRGIGKSTIDKINETANRERKSNWEILCNIENYGFKKNDNIKNFVSLIKDLQNIKKERDLLSLCALLVNKIEFREYLERFPEFEIRVNNVDELLNDVKTFIKDDRDLKLEDYINRISLLSEIDDFHSEEDFIHIITIHNAKGLEFKNVFIIGLQEGMFPHYKVLEDVDSDIKLEEERRLFYVGLTRAKDIIYLIHPQTYNFFGNNRITDASRFLSEIDKEYIELL